MNGCHDHARPWITCIPQVATRKNDHATIFHRVFPSLDDLSLSSLVVDREKSLKRRREKKREREERKKKKRVSIGKRGRNLFVSGRKNGRPVEAKPADCLVSGMCVCVCRSTRQSRRRAGTARAKM